MNLSEYPEPQGPPTGQPETPAGQHSPPAGQHSPPAGDQIVQYPPPRPGATSSTRFPYWIILMVAVLVVGAIGSFMVLQDRNDSEAAQQTERTETQDGGSANSENQDASESTGGEAPARDADQSEDEPLSAPQTGDANHVGCEAGTLEIVCELIAFVEIERGRPFKDFPVVDLQENDEFDEGLLADFDEDSEELEISGHVLSSLGLIPKEADLVELFRSMLEVSVVGYYSTENHILVVRGAEFDLYSQLVLVHELTHAHDDQWLDLDRPELDDVQDEEASGFLAVVEGNASRVEDAWRDSLSEGEQEELNALELTALSPSDIEKILALPSFILEMQFSPYQDGPVLVNAIVDEGGEAAVDEAFANPPHSTEQILHPEQYLRGESVPVRPVPSAPSGANIVDDGVVGELAIRSWLGAGAAQGWNGDGYVTWTEGSRSCSIVEIAGDTPDDLDELFDAARAWADNGSDRSVDALAGAVRIQGCVG